MTSQLTLPVGLSDGASFENFFAPATGAAVDAVRDLALADRNTGALLHGQSGSGKTHLAWALCRLARDHGRVALYVPLRQDDLAMSLLHELPDSAVVCIDDLEGLVGHTDLQHRLFSLVEHLNHARSLQILFTTGATLRNLDIGLADLVSRIGAVPGHELKSLGDLEKSGALRLRAKVRGLTISDDAIDYILRHTPRDTHALFGLLDELDRASLVAQRRVTLPLVREVIARPQAS